MTQGVPGAPSGDAELTRMLSEALAHLPAGRIGLAVSGGSDSVALLHLAAATGRDLAVATVDHDLRPGSAEEARFVRATCHRLGVDHDILIWRRAKLSGNLQAGARAARYGLMADWARHRGIAHVLLGHTADDQAETFLMRLTRRAGVDGLSAMAPSFRRDGVTFHRPLLGASRLALRGYLAHRGLEWRDDPSNDDARFDRTRARRAMAALADLGIGAGHLSQVARNLASARDELDRVAGDAARDIARRDRGDLLIGWNALHALGHETRRRIVRLAIAWIAGAAYPPREAALERFLARLDRQEIATLGGCLATFDGGEIRLTREWSAVRDLTADPHETWDRRWCLEGPDEAGARVRALGPDGLSMLADWRLSGLPRRSLLSSPSLWRGGTLVSAPLAGYANGWSVRLADDRADFPLNRVSH